MWYIVIAGVVTTVFATAIKLELGEPGSLYCGGNMRLYLSLVTGHAVVMVFLAYVPVYYGVFTNYLIPIQLGARDFAYPRLNNFSFWVFPPSLFFFFKRPFEVPRARDRLDFLSTALFKKVLRKLQYGYHYFISSCYRYRVPN